MKPQPPTIKEKIVLVFKGKNDQVFKPYEIIDLILQKYPDTNKSSILPADRCYNIINKGIEHQFKFHVFEALEDGSYRFLGENYQYSGPILWKGKIVGEWLNGHKSQILPLE